MSTRLLHTITLDTEVRKSLESSLATALSRVESSSKQKSASTAFWCSCEKNRGFNQHALDAMLAPLNPSRKQRLWILTVFWSLTLYGTVDTSLLKHLEETPLTKDLSMSGTTKENLRTVLSKTLDLNAFDADTHRNAQSVFVTAFWEKRQPLDHSVNQAILVTTSDDQKMAQAKKFFWENSAEKPNYLIRKALGKTLDLNAFDATVYRMAEAAFIHTYWNKRATLGIAAHHAIIVTTSDDQKIAQAKNFFWAALRGTKTA
ncbi:hypothetical protein A2791_05035 [Candidatus Saccharibacteria bacterium RIFCSPHIGHO2_01_FULL_46_30]|nr:MAG: hypothetical protein A2791_05035 [Candidatus Saccharibacteria bacterium RIFCSPHIGHO2_01_FULL_46_30]